MSVSENRHVNRPEPAAALNALVSRVDNLTHDVRAITLRIEPPIRLRFAAGQFVSFSIQRPGQRFAMTRAYTIASAPDIDDEIVLLLNLVDGGPGSEYLFGLQVGDRTTFRGPYGSFVLPANDRPLLLVATDTGIAPFMSMLPWLATHTPQRTATLIWGLRSQRDVYYQRELASLATRMPNLTCITTLFQPGDGWRGPTGRVQAALQAQVPSVIDLEAYICGGSAMIQDVVGWLRARGECAIHREPYYKDAPPTTDDETR